MLTITVDLIEFKRELVQKQFSEDEIYRIAGALFDASITIEERR